MVPADSDRIPRVPPYSGSALVSHPLPVREYHPLCPDFPDGSSSCVMLCARPYNPDDAVTPSVWALPLSIATTQGIDFLFLEVLRCFSSLRSPHLMMVTGLQPAGLPHSDMCGSNPVCKSPHLFAAYHVLRRLRKPRHPPFALLSFLYI